jgi:hypothetical protein
MKKKAYTIPDIERIAIDYTISMELYSTEVPQGGDGGGFKPRSEGNKSPASDPFESPFSDKPFN